MNLKQLKAELKKLTDANPEKYYATEVLKEKGFERKKCSKCGRYFWTASDEDFCGEAECTGGYKFIGDSPTSKKMDFIETWKEFSKLFSKLGYMPIKRYPVVARWRDDTYWVNASIYDFQPHVVSGAIQPPANPLVVPQACVRFNDIDNVGITGSHYTSFVMIGQHAFTPPDKFDQDQYFRDILAWLEQGMKLPRQEIKFHEDQWGGGGNLGVCMEFFARGLEIGNQVYMKYQITPTGYKDLDLKVLDMGMGQERPAWLSHGTNTSYEANFPTVAEQLYKIAGSKPDQDILKSFLPYSGLLNMEEADDINKVWENIAKNIHIDVKHLKDTILPLAALYSVGDHTRTLLLAINDGALPSNVGGCYNLRVLLRRALGYIDRYDWDISLADICETHAKYLKPQYPELMENLDDVSKILDVERKKYDSTVNKSKGLVRQIIREGVTDGKLVELYDSKGITPEFLKEEAEKLGKTIDVPEDFYAKVAARHEPTEIEIVKKEEVDLGDISDTEKLFYKDYKQAEFDAIVLKVLGKEVILDKTAFYPTAGGQDCDEGSIDGKKVASVRKVGNVILHQLVAGGLKEGDKVHGELDIDRRLQLTKNHTAAHLIGGAARQVLGKHIWQAGSQIDLGKGRLDVTHYSNITPEERDEIEKLANRVIKENREIDKRFIPRNDAEAQYGFTLYQGGAVPGKEIRVVKVKDWDVQACGGTHLDNTGEAEGIEIIKTEKIQDGVVRIVFVAGSRLLKAREKKETGLLGEALASVKPLAKPEAEIDDLETVAQTFSVTQDQLPNTLARFVKEFQENNEKMEGLGGKKVGIDKKDTLISFSKDLFEKWKAQKKSISGLEAGLMGKRIEEIVASKEKLAGIEFVRGELPDFGLAMRVGQEILSKKPQLVVFLIAQGRTVCLVDKAKTDAQKVLEKNLKGAKISGNRNRAVADKPLSLKASITFQ